MNFYHFASLILGYCLAAIFSSFVSFTLTATVWTSIWTYIVLAFWWFIALFITWLIPVVFLGGGMLVIAGFLGGLVALLEGWSNWRRRR